MKTVYIVSGYFWDAEKKEYDKFEISKHDRVEDALVVYDALKPTENMNQVEVWEEELNRYGVAVTDKRIRLKDTSGEYDEPGLGGGWYEDL